MTDHLNPEKRSALMSRIRSTGTKPEEVLASALDREAVGYERHAPLPGRPDFFFPEVKLAVFVDGDFWHRCPVHASKVPETRRDFWTAKFARNQERDRQNETALKRMDIVPVRVWECEVTRKPASVAAEILHVRAMLLRGVTISDLGWMGGFVDGEGTVTVQNNRAAGPSQLVAVANNHIEACEAFARMFAFGKAQVWASTRTRLHKWRVVGAVRCGATLRALKCFLVLKRAQAELISVYGSMVITDRALGRRRLSDAMVRERGLITDAVRSLNARGLMDRWRGNLSKAAARAWKKRSGGFSARV